MIKLQQYNKMFSTIPGVSIGIGLAEAIIPILKESSLQLSDSVLNGIYLMIVIGVTAFLVYQAPNKNLIPKEEVKKQEGE